MDFISTSVTCLTIESYRWGLGFGGFYQYISYLHDNRELSLVFRFWWILSVHQLLACQLGESCRWCLGCGGFYENINCLHDNRESSLVFRFGRFYQ